MRQILSRIERNTGANLLISAWKCAARGDQAVDRLDTQISVGNVVDSWKRDHSPSIRMPVPAPHARKSQHGQALHPAEFPAASSRETVVVNNRRTASNVPACGHALRRCPASRRESQKRRYALPASSGAVSRIWDSRNDPACEVFSDSPASVIVPGSDSLEAAGVTPP